MTAIKIKVVDINTATENQSSSNDPFQPLVELKHVCKAYGEGKDNTSILKDINLKGKFVLITGATKGIGRSTAVAMHQVGASIIAVGRNKNELSTLKKKLRTRHSAVIFIFVKSLK